MGRYTNTVVHNLYNALNENFFQDTIFDGDYLLQQILFTRLSHTIILLNLKSFIGPQI